MGKNRDGYTLDPVTFEVLKNAYVNIVDQMAEQIFRTCYSFVIWSRDFSSAICDTEGNTIMQGSGDIAAHVGTLHYTAQAVINKFGDDIHPRRHLRRERCLPGRHPLQRHAHRAPRLLQRHPSRLRPGQRPLGRCRRRGAGFVQRERAGPHGRGAPHHAGAGLQQGHVPLRRGRADRQQHPRSGRHHRRPAGAGGGLQRRRARDRPALRQVRRRRNPDLLRRGAGLCRDPDPPAHRQAARRRLGDGRLYRRGPRRWRGADSDPHQDDDRRRRRALRPLRLASEDDLYLPQLLLRRCLRGDRRRHQDAIARHPAELGLLSRRHRRSRAAGDRGQRRLADPGRGLLLGPLREDHELRVRALGRDPARARHGLHLQPGISADRRARRPQGGPPLLHVVRLDGGRLGRPQRPRRLGGDRAGLRRAARHPALRGTGAAGAGADHGPRADRRFRRPRQLARRPRRREGRDPDQGGALGRLLLLRPRALRDLGPVGRPAVDPARRLGQSRHPGRTLSGLDLLPACRSRPAIP